MDEFEERRQQERATMRARQNPVLKPFVKEEMPSMQIESVSLKLMSSEDACRLSQMQVLNKDMYETGTFNPVPYGCLDPRLGVSTNKGECATCHKDLQDCVGHFGHVRLEFPVFHVGYYREILRILQCICKSCARLLLEDPVRDKFLKQLQSPVLTRDRRRDILATITKESKKVRKCPHCAATNGNVKKLRTCFRYVHEPFAGKALQKSEERAQWLAEFDEAARSNPDVDKFKTRGLHDLTPDVCLRLFRRMLRLDAAVLGMPTSNPADLIISTLVVPPVCIRPSVPMSATGSNEDDLTIKISDIVYINNHLKQLKSKGASPAALLENWNFLQQQVAMLLNADMPGFPPAVKPTKRIRSLAQRLKGKTGRFRWNLSGKRVDFSARAVISPDPNLHVTEVGVPLQVAQKLTVPERVTPHNLARLRRAVQNGPEVHPGANFLQRGGNDANAGTKQYLKYGDRMKRAEGLRVGDIVERHLSDGDMVLFNRQPSLHRISIMSHRVRVMPWRTFRFNVCVCNPYNADFDGDEMNLHVPQTLEAVAEAKTLMRVDRNFITPKNGAPIVAPLQDFITASYLLTCKDVFLTRAEFMQICAYFADAAEHIDMPPPAIWHPVPLWTGKQVWNILLDPRCGRKHRAFGDRVQDEADFPLHLDFELKAKNYKGPKDKLHPIMCPHDGYVVFSDSELMCGNICKATLGGSKKGLFFRVIRDVSAQCAASIMGRLSKVCARWLGERGFSIGIDDVSPSIALRKKIDEVLEGGYERCNVALRDYREGTLKPLPGCDMEQTLESKMLSELSKVREQAFDKCLDEMSPLHNAGLIMAQSGAKGSGINIAQMVACVGQQAVSGSRIADGFVDRTLPHFLPLSREPDSKGFVQNSFFTGLSATEFFFHTMAGREGLVDTAVKTAETGYMQRRLMKALEDLCVHYDDTVRNSENTLLQFCFGEDGVDPMATDIDELPVNFGQLLRRAQRETQQIDSALMTAEQIDSSIDDLIESQRSWSENFKDQTLAWCTALADEVKKCSQSEILRRNTFVTEAAWQRLWQLLPMAHHRAQVDAGTAVGAVAGQSIGEPGTQMTLKTFHFAGVSSMNITLGVPRIKEIINASTTIATPIIEAALEDAHDEKLARRVQARLQTTKLADICASISQVCRPGSTYVDVRLDAARIKLLCLDEESVCAPRIQAAVLASKAPGLKELKEANVRVLSPLRLKVFPADTDPQRMLFLLARIRRQLPDLVVSGIKSVSRAVIHEDDKEQGKYKMLVEGTGLQHVIGVPGVNGLKSKSNHCLEMFDVLGIEAARHSIIHEITYTMHGHGLDVDPRHMMLCADLMTNTGTVLGITRFGIGKMKSSILMLASFEKTVDHLFDGAFRGVSDPIAGVSECIIMGKPMPIGTGLFKMLRDTGDSVTAAGDKDAMTDQSEAAEEHKKPAVMTRRVPLLERVQLRLRLRQRQAA